MKYQDIADYMSRNRLVLNTDKTHLLVMASRAGHRAHQNYDITLNTGTEIMEWNLHVSDERMDPKRTPFRVH